MRFPPRPQVWPRLALLLLAIVLLGRCDTSLTPFGDETGLYSVYGYLTLHNSPHYLRIKPLDTPLRSGSPAPLDVTVTLTDVSTGQTETLVDSVVNFNQVFAHNFRTTQDIRPGTTYRLQIERPDGQATRATATTPRDTDVRITPSPPASIECDRGLTLRFTGLQGGSRVQISGGIVWDDSLRWTRSDLTVPEGDSVQTTGGYLPWRIVKEVVPRAVWAPISEKADYCNILDENTLHVAYTHFGPGWPADSVRTDPTRSTVENGLGVFGGLRRDTLTRTLK